MIIGTLLRTGLVRTGLAVLALVCVPLPAAAADAWRWPVPEPAVVLRPFEQPTGPYGPGHRGVDLAARTDGVVRAAAAGTVVVAGVVAGRPVVVVAHGAARTVDELRTTYEPVEASVEVGARVEAGAALGRLGSWPGHCDRPCLHWGLRRGEVYLDPLPLLTGPVRLLPAGAPAPVRVVDVDRSPGPERARASPPVAAVAPGDGDGRRTRSALLLAGGAGVVAGAFVTGRRLRPRRSAA